MSPRMFMKFLISIDQKEAKNNLIQDPVFYAITKQS